MVTTDVSPDAACIGAANDATDRSSTAASVGDDSIVMTDAVIRSNGVKRIRRD